MSPLKLKRTLNKRFHSTYKKNYTVKWQVTCNMNKKVHHLGAVVYWSLYDSTVYRSTGLYFQPDLFFAHNEYIIGDSRSSCPGDVSSRIVCPIRHTPCNLTYWLQNNFFLSLLVVSWLLISNCASGFRWFLNLSLCFSAMTQNSYLLYNKVFFS